MQTEGKIILFSEIIAQLNKYDLVVEYDKPQKEISFHKPETDSRLISENDIFICIKGYKFDGHNFAQSAVKNGAKLLICEQKQAIAIPQIIVKNSRKSAAVLAKYFFGNPSSKFKLIGITGTNGKTTISHIVEYLLRKNGKKTGLIGTLGYYINGKHFPLERTTPDIVELNRILTKMNAEKVEYVVMEVSSHSLALDRVFGLEFDVALLTNITRDHLDFHKNLRDYAETKFKLFRYTNENKGISIFNIDDEYGKKFYQRLKGKKFSISFFDADYGITNWQTNPNGSNFRLSIGEKTEEFKTKLSGKFNVFNAAAAVAILTRISPEISLFSLKVHLKNFQTVPGRLEQIKNKRNLNIFIDYAHTPDALENVLTTLSEMKKERIITVFGAGGNRDKQKRPQMLKAVLKHSDLAIVTSDNPRNEKPEDIIRDIVKGTNPFSSFWIVTKRTKAIETAVKLASENDIILIAGKGHEKYQEINGKKIHFDDKEEALKACEAIYEEKTETEKLAIPIDTLELEILFSSDKITESKLLDSVSTDSRTISENSLFFALAGENFDGHNFVDEVLNRKNCFAVVQKKKSEKKNIFLVENTLKALGLLAKKYKSLFKIKTVAITGSVGKTTTKEYIFNILSEIAPTLKTLGNENNLIGLPKTIFRIKPIHKFAVLELGSNHFGEISYLADICSPDIGIITSVGAAHLEFFGNLDGVFKEKSSLLRRPLELKIYPDDEKFSEFAGITFGTSSHCDYRISKIKPSENSTSFFVNFEEFSIPTPYEKFVPNATIAIALASEMQISKSLIRKGLQKPLSISQRMEIIPFNDGFILNDCYNANPDSMKAAIAFWLKFHPEKPHVAVLGDMLELGEKTDFFHREIGKILKNEHFHLLISVGKFARSFQAKFHFPSVQKLIDSKIYKTFSANSVILLKASHSVALEKLIPYLRQITVIQRKD